MAGAAAAAMGPHRVLFPYATSPKLAKTQCIEQGGKRAHPSTRYARGAPRKPWSRCPGVAFHTERANRLAPRSTRVSLLDRGFLGCRSTSLPTYNMRHPTYNLHKRRSSCLSSVWSLCWCTL
eukprot:scaffold129140_cov75-Phaeocystis_antarctica.AAC.1